MPTTNGNHSGSGFLLLSFTLYFSPAYKGLAVKIVVIVLLVAIVVSLGSGLFHMSGQDHDSARLLKALKIRVALSFVLIVVLVLGYFAGWIVP